MDYSSAPDFWKNFRLGRELEVAGNFIFDGILHFHHMRHFSYEEKVFEFLHDVSTGVERLLMICIVLVEHDEASNQEEFEASLLVHDHRELIGRLCRQRDLKLSPAQNEFIQLLGRFYKSYRYDRFRLESVHNEGREKEDLRNFLATQFEVNMIEDGVAVGTFNNQKIRSKMAELISDIAKKLYRIVFKEASRLNLYTYELRSDSKSSLLFSDLETDFSIEDRTALEFLIFLMNTSENNDKLEFIRKIKPLDLDPAMVDDFIRSFNSYAERAALVGEIECAYENLEGTENLEERNAKLDFLLSEEFEYFAYMDTDDD